MSGIVGAVQLNEAPLAEGVLRAMLKALRHRGADGLQAWQQGRMGIGHASLNTAPGSANQVQPAWNQQQTCIITADIRLDNREVLLSAFEIAATDAATTSDSQLVLAAYQRWGDHCVDYLKGDFAFAIWDRQQQHLFCARDRFGVKPFYYYYSPGEVFGFASEIKALWQIPGVRPQLNETRIGDYLISEFDDPQITFYQQVYRLPAAHTLSLSLTKIKVYRYWVLDPEHETILPSNADYAERYRELFLQAVQTRMQSPNTVGTMLSGGLDSSSIACTARLLREQQGDRTPIPTFSAVFAQAKASDERPFIDAALAQGGFQPFFIEGDSLSPLTANFSEFLTQLDEPHYAFNLFLNWNLFALAQSQQVRVILDGFDGDSTVSHGSGYLPELAKTGQWLTLAQELKGVCKQYSQPYWPSLWSYTLKFGIKDSLRQIPPIRGAYHAARSLKQRIRPTPVVETTPNWAKALNPEFVQRIGLVERRQQLRRSLIESTKSARAEHCYSLARSIMPFTLEILDRASANFGIELRFPFWDQDLVEYCLSLPAKQKLNQGWTRMVMRRGMAGILPEAIQWRPGKSNLGYGFEYACTQFERSRLVETLDQLSERGCEYINRDVWRRAQEHWLSEAKSENDEMMITWRSFNLVQWLHHTGL